MREIAGFLLGFGCDFAVWVLISGLRVLSDSWVFRVLICAEAVIGFGGGPVLKCHGRNAAECKMIKTNNIVACLPKFNWLFDKRAS
jgi:hypothetical protein